jgi:signal transduction histidine kinase/tetratricopeptide (TPR) repeat protein
MQRFVLCFLFWPLFSCPAQSQTSKVIDSLENAVKVGREDSNRVKTLNELSFEYGDVNPGKSLLYAMQANQLAGKLNFKRGLSSSFNNIGNYYSDAGKYADAIAAYEKCLDLKKQLGDKPGIATLYANIGRVYKIKGDYQHAFRFCILALKMRKEIGVQKGIADSYNNIGNLFWAQGKLDSALVFLLPSLEIRTAINDKKGIAFSNNNVGGVYNDKGLYDKALVYYYASEKMLEEIGDRASQSSVTINIGNIYRHQKRFDRALEYFFKALSIDSSMGNKNLMASCYNKLGSVYDDLGKYPEALSYYQKSLFLKETTGEKQGIAEAMNNIGLICKYQQHYDLALDWFYKALKLKEEIGDKMGLISANNNIGSVLGRQGKYSEAYKYLRKAEMLAKETGARAFLKDNYEIFAETYAMQKDFKNAYEYNQLHARLKYELFNETNTASLLALQTAYETEKKDAEITIFKQQEKDSKRLLEDQKEIVQKRNYLLLSCALLILSLAAGGYYYFSRQRIQALRQKERAIIETEEKERARMAKDIHDDLGSGLSKIKFLTELVSEESADKESNLQAISETSNKLLENMRDLIWALNPENTTLDNLIARIREYSSDYVDGFPIDITLHFPDSIPSLQISKSANRNLFLTLKECLQNAMKHAKATNLVVELTLDDGCFKLWIRDNGQGFDTSTIVSGNGLHNLNYRMKNIGGSFQIRSSKDNGTEICLGVDLSAMAQS